MLLRTYMINKNKELINILCQNFPETYKRSQLNPEDEFVTYASVIHMLAEGRGYFNTESPEQLRVRVDWDCVNTVVLGLFDVASLVEDYASLIRGGGSWTTVRGLLWRTAKRYGGWVAAAGLIYDISTDCIH